MNHQSIPAGGMCGKYLGSYYFRSPGRKVISTSKGPESCLIIMLTGWYRAECRDPGRNRMIEASAGDVVLWPAGRERLESNDPSKPMQCLVIMVELEHVPAALPLLVHDSRGLIRNIGDLLVQSRTWPPLLRAGVENGYLAGLLAEYQRLACLKQDELVYRVTRYVEEHITEHIRLTDLAKHIGLHKHHFIRKYKAHTSQTPVDAVRRIRAEYARGMLASPQRWTLRQIARHIGLANESQVSRLIRRYIGIPVRDLRK